MPSVNNRWWSVVAGFIGSGVGAGIFVAYAFGLIAPVIAAEFGWDRAVLGSCVSLFLFGNGLGTVALGHLITRFGVRRPAIAMVAIFALAVAGLAFLPANATLFRLDFLLMGLSGAAATGMPYVICICSRFDSTRGLALGIAAMGGGLGSIMMPQLASVLTGAIPWRETLLVMASICGAVPFLLLTFLVRTPPEVVVPRGAARLDPEHRYSTYVRDRCFWVIGIAIAASSVAAMGTIYNLGSLLVTRGLSSGEAAAILSTAGTVSLLTRLVVGWLLDRVFAAYVGAGIFVLSALGAVFFLNSSGAWLYVSAALVAVSYGAEVDFVSYFVSRYFRGASVTRIIGLLWVAWAWGGGVGTALCSLSFSLTGAYDLAFWSFGGLLVFAAGLLLTLPPYRFARHAAAPIASNPLPAA